MKVEELELYRIHNSRAEAAVAAKINGFRGAAPSGASAGTYEASGKIPEDLKQVEKEIQNRVLGEDLNQEEFDQILRNIDGTDNFRNIGAVSIACSLAFSNAEGYSSKTVFPYPLGNVVGGGEHGGNTDIQEFLVIPLEAESFPEAMETNADIFHEMEERYSTKIRGKNDEGALITSMNDEETLKALKKVADDHGANIGLDMAANELWDGRKYVYGENQMELSPNQQLKKVKRLIEKYDLYYVEDPFHEDDFESHRKLLRGQEELIVGDDVFVTNPERVERGIDFNSCNSIIIKPNQAGTVSTTRETVLKAFENDYVPVISHRSGETCDTSISELALEWEIPVIKAGITDIRIVKLNALALKWQKMEEEGRNPEMAAVR